MCGFHLIRTIEPMTRGVFLHDLHTAPVAMHVAEPADVHENVEAELLSAAIRPRDLIEPAAMAQSQVHDLTAPRVGHARDYFANLPVRVMRILIQQRGGE